MRTVYERIDMFHGHLDKCSQCRDHPFGLCSTGARLLRYAATGEVEPQKCGNCGIWRQVTDYMVEKCPFCGDDEYSLVENEDATIS